MTTDNKCIVAIIGAGYMAREHIRAFTDVPNVTIAGIHSRTHTRAESLAAEYNIPVVCDSIPELYEKTQADLVVVTVSIMAMNVISQTCFTFPWTVLLEKPPGYNLLDAKEINAIAKEKNRLVLVALNRRFYASTQAALEDVNQLEIPRFIHVQDQEDQKEALEIGQPQTVMDNWMYANSIHVIDYLRIFGRGKIKLVEPVIAWNPEKPGVVVSKIEFDSGDIGLYEGIWKGPGPWAVNVSTSVKRWELRPLERAAFQLQGERQLQSIESHIWDQTFKPGLRQQAEMAVAAALSKPSTSPTLEEALETMRLIQQIFSISA